MSVCTQNLAKDSLYGIFFPSTAIRSSPVPQKQDWIRILTDPDPPEMTRLLHVGQFVTWPKVCYLEVPQDMLLIHSLVTYDKESYAFGASNLPWTSSSQGHKARSILPCF